MKEQKSPDFPNDLLRTPSACTYIYNSVHAHWIAAHGVNIHAAISPSTLFSVPKIKTVQNVVNAQMYRMREFVIFLFLSKFDWLNMLILCCGGFETLHVVFGVVHRMLHVGIFGFSQ